ncbi:hypothetical protein [Nocardia sp. NPDC049526]|uniref:hypothetical protein n=1 Tax=Nocardia sp. NPDC049526 TaxID=3364316 RepID=UPI003794A7F5
MADDDEPGRVSDAEADAVSIDEDGSRTDAVASEQDRSDGDAKDGATLSEDPVSQGVPEHVPQRRDEPHSDKGPRVPRPRVRLLTAVVAVTALVAVAAAVGSGYLADHHRTAQAASDRRLAFVQSARQEVLNVLTVHYDSADNDVQRILDGATGQWRAEFAPQAQPFAGAVREAKVVTTAEIAGAGLEHVNDDGSALVLLTAHSKVSNSAGAHEEPRTFRVRATVSPDGDRLKISKMEYVVS